MVAVFTDERRAMRSAYAASSTMCVRRDQWSRKHRHFRADDEPSRPYHATPDADGIEWQRLNVSHAFHSPLMEPMLDDFEQVAGTVKPSRRHSIGLVSNLTGRTGRRRNRYRGLLAAACS